MRLNGSGSPAPAILLLLAAALGGCASGPPRGGDGVESNPPAGLARVPDAQPRLETVRSGGPNKPYEVLGREYVPITHDRPITEHGLASWYGRKFHGRRTSSGEPYDMYAMTAAHPTLPIPSYARVRNPANGREVLVRINDRGPFHAGRIVDLSYTAALKLDLLRGVAPVELTRITSDDIRTGAWRRSGDVPALAAMPVPAPVAMPPPVAAPALPLIAPALPVVADAVPVPAEAVAVVADAPLPRPTPAATRGFWIQLGAFSQRDGADGFQRRVAAELEWLTPLLAVFSEAGWYRLQAGPYPSRDEARAAAERVRESLQLVPVVVERR